MTSPVTPLRLPLGEVDKVTFFLIGDLHVPQIAILTPETTRNPQQDSSQEFFFASHIAQESFIYLTMTNSIILNMFSEIMKP